MGFLADLSMFTSIYWLPVCLGLVAVRLASNRYRKGLSGIPGPFLASLSDLWILVHYCRRRGLEEYDLHQKYNSQLLRIGPNPISVADAEAVRVIYGWKPVFSKASIPERHLGEWQLTGRKESALHIAGCHHRGRNGSAECVFDAKRGGASRPPPSRCAHVLSEHARRV